jgi:hypothetical protein
VTKKPLCKWCGTEVDIHNTLRECRKCWNVRTALGMSSKHVSDKIYKYMYNDRFKNIVNYLVVFIFGIMFGYFWCWQAFN